MQEPLYKHLKKRTFKVEQVSADMIRYEEACPFYKDFPGGALISDDIEVGIEIEVERVGANLITSYPVWSQRADGSLRDQGMEYVTVPIRGWRIPFALNHFYSALNKGAHFSPRTSVHVHMNVLDLTPKQIAGVLITNAVFERILFRFIGADRDKSNFCVPMTESSCNVLSYFIGDDFSVPNFEQYRYMATNVDAVRKFGSLEFRHMPGTHDKVKIVKWINLLFCLKIFAVHNSLDDIKRRINRLNTDSQYLAFFNDVFGNCGAYLDSRSLQADMEGAISKVKQEWSDHSLKKKIQTDLSTSSVWYEYLAKSKKKKKEEVDVLMFNVAPAPRARRAVRAEPFGAFRAAGVDAVRRGQEVAPPPEPADWRAQDIGDDD